MEAQNFVLRIYDGEELIEQRFVWDVKMATYFVECKACDNKEVWGEVFELKSDEALLISSDGSIEPAITDKEDKYEK